MSNAFKALANLICYSDAALNPKKWLAQEAAELGLEIDGLDRISPQAIMVLAKLVSDGPLGKKSLAYTFELDDSTADDCVDGLFELGFVQTDGIIYTATATGERAFTSIGSRIIARHSFETKNHLEQVEQLKRLFCC